ncbi:MAG: hypothetical protein F6K41_25210 [Symploca sp. SIO3E6]|nr:hypothetical protein [Caldora sp. SIO3E6]
MFSLLLDYSLGILLTNYNLPLIDHLDYLVPETATILLFPHTHQLLRGRVQQQAIDELEALPANNSLRSNTLRLLYNLRKNLEFRQDLEEGDRKLIMRLAPLYQQEREQILLEGEQRGIQQGERLIVNNLLQVRFGDVDEELAAIIEPLLALPPEEFTPMLLQLSREDLLARFRKSD